MTFKSNEMIRLFPVSCGILCFAKIVLSDNGPLFNSKELNGWMESLGIQHNTSSPYFPQQNGMVERFMRNVNKAGKIAKLLKVNIMEQIRIDVRILQIFLDILLTKCKFAMRKHFVDKSHHLRFECELHFHLVESL
jgi:transposase InsO family protein